MLLRKLKELPAKADANIERKLIRTAKKSPTVIVFAIVLLLALSVSASLDATLAWLRSILVAIRICAIENISPITEAIRAFFIETPALK